MKQEPELLPRHSIEPERPRRPRKPSAKQMKPRRLQRRLIRKD